MATRTLRFYTVPERTDYRIFPDIVYKFRASPFAYIRPSGTGPLFWNMIIMPFEAGPPLKTFGVRSDSRPNSRWTSDGRAIIYNLTHGVVLSGVTNLWNQSLAGGPQLLCRDQPANTQSRKTMLNQ